MSDLAFQADTGALMQMRSDAIRTWWAERQLASSLSIAGFLKTIFEAPIKTRTPLMKDGTSGTTVSRASKPLAAVPYLNPLRHASGIVSKRIDQGVDYRATGGSPLYALGKGRVVAISNWGWPNGTFIAYRLTSGPAQGKYVYAAEDLIPRVSVGQSVNSSTIIGTFVAGSDGGYDIEIGWANGRILGDSMARGSGQWDGYDSTAFGWNFSRLLKSLGAPGGIPQGTVQGSLPPRWRA